MISILLLAAQTPTPADVWAKTVEAYGQVPTYNATFTTTVKGKKGSLYTGKLTFTRDKSLAFELKDTGENCRAGYTWTKDNGGSTWVSPDEFRGYNDTLTARHPYLLVSLLEKSSDPMEWTETVKSAKVGKDAHWSITDKSGYTFLVNASTWMISSYTGPELYDEERICTTVVKS
jgi:hypothetical protein